MPVTVDDDVNNEHENASVRRREKENNLRVRRNNGILISNEELPENRLHNDHSNTDDIPLIHDDSLHALFVKARDWIERNDREIEDIVVLPKLWGERLKKVKKKITTLFDEIIKNLTLKLNTIFNDSNISDENKFMVLEGVLDKTHHLLRKELRSSLHIPKFQKNKTPHIPKSLDLPIMIKYTTKFTAGIELIHNLLMDDAPDQPTLNLISDIKQKATIFLNRAPEDFTQFLGGNDLNAIDALLNAHNFDEKLNFLNKKLEELEVKHCSNHSASFKRFIQKAYAEDAKKTLHWFILSSDSPECTVPVEHFVEDYGACWQDKAILTPDDDFQLNHLLSDEDNGKQ